MQVKNLQVALNNIYSQLPPLVTDGNYGPATRARVIEFQGLNGLPQSGIADSDTQFLIQMQGGDGTADWNAGFRTTVNSPSSNPFDPRLGASAANISLGSNASGSTESEPGLWDWMASVLSPVTDVASPVIDTSGNVYSAAGRVAQSGLDAANTASSLARQSPSISLGILAVAAVALFVIFRRAN